MAWVSTLMDHPQQHTLTLVLALTKGDAFGTALRMCTELGADTFIPLQAHRSIPKGDKQSRWSKIVNGAAAQSKRLTIPQVLPLQTWNSLWGVLEQDNVRWMLHPTPEKECGSISNDYEHHSLYWTLKADLQIRRWRACLNKNCKPRSLGRLVLKADTAATVACARVLS